MTSLHDARVDPSHLVPSVLTPPISKSDAQRALVLAHLTGAWPLPDLQNEPEHFLPADVRVLRRGIEALRLPAGPRARRGLRGRGRPLPHPRHPGGGDARRPRAPHRHPRLGERPHGPLFQSLREALGPSGLVLTEGNPWPVELHAPA